MSQSGTQTSETSQTGAQTFKLGPREILNYAWQVAKGMNYLAGMKVTFYMHQAKALLDKEWPFN